MPDILPNVCDAYTQQVSYTQFANKEIEARRSEADPPG